MFRTHRIRQNIPNDPLEIEDHNSNSTEDNEIFREEQEEDEHFVERRDLFGFVRFVMEFTAMYPLRERLQCYLPEGLHWLATFLDLFYEIFSLVANLHIGVLYLVTLYLYREKGDLEFSVHCLIQAIIYFWGFGMKILFRRIGHKQVKELIYKMNHEHPVRSSVGKQITENSTKLNISKLIFHFKGFSYVTMKEALQLSNKFLKSFVYCCFFGTSFWSILPMIYNDGTLPLTCWYPFDYHVCALLKISNLSRKFNLCVYVCFFFRYRSHIFIKGYISFNFWHKFKCQQPFQDQVDSLWSYQF